MVSTRVSGCSERSENGVYDELLLQRGSIDLEAVPAEDKLNRMDCESNMVDDEIQEHHEKLWSHIISTKVENLPAMLCKLYDSLDREDVAAGFGFYQLEPEWQAKSTDPVHPLALIHKEPVNHGAQSPATKEA